MRRIPFKTFRKNLQDAIDHCREASLSSTKFELRARPEMCAKFEEALFEEDWGGSIDQLGDRIVFHARDFTLILIPDRTIGQFEPGTILMRGFLDIQRGSPITHYTMMRVVAQSEYDTHVLHPRNIDEWQVDEFIDDIKVWCADDRGIEIRKRLDHDVPEFTLEGGEFEFFNWWRKAKKTG